MGCGVVGWTQKDEDAGNDANTVAHKNGGEGDGADVALKFGQATTGSWGVHCSADGFWRCRRRIVVWVGNKRIV